MLALPPSCGAGGVVTELRSIRVGENGQLGPHPRCPDHGDILLRLVALRPFEMVCLYGCRWRLEVVDPELRAVVRQEWPRR